MKQVLRRKQSKMAGENKKNSSVIRNIAVAGIALSLGAFFPHSLAAQSGAFSSEAALSRSETGARSAASGLADQEFRRGVQAYYRGAFNDAVMQFEKALSYLPAENIILDWLGRSYYRAGIEGAALQQWQFASDSGYGGLLLKNRIDIVRERRVTDNRYDSPVRYTEAGSYSGIAGDDGKTLVFSQPVSVLPNDDGTAWVLAYGTNELVRIDVNGLVVTRTGGPLNGFDRPMDLIRLSGGNLLVSEFAGDRISELSPGGRFVRSFGHKGRDVGGMIGPQYMAEDEDGNIYVSDFGNARVDVFDKDGEPLFSFGDMKSRTGGFSGLKGPTGIAVVKGSVYVADNVTGAVYRFDTAGNFISLLCREKTFVLPESMKAWGNYLIVCDRNRVFSVDCETGALFENVSTGNAPSRVTSAVPDVNGNILVTDFTSNEVFVMSKMSELVGGLFVQIERVDSDKFPKVTLDVKVENRRRQSIVGLKGLNFRVTENGANVADLKLEGAAYANEFADITLVLDRSEYSAGDAGVEAMETAVREIAASMDSGVLRIVSAGAVPVVEYEGAPAGVAKFTCAALKTPVSKNVSLDLALRLAANGLINAESKRAVIFIGGGNVTQGAFGKYSLSDLTAYYNNNSISFATILLENASAADEIAFIRENTEGGEYYVYRSQGLSGVVPDIVGIPSGIYRLSYTSALQTEFGRKYLPVEVETYLMNRSGRDETGYFAPLQ